MIRMQIEEMEEKVLSPFATFSAKSKGRERPEEECQLRTKFQIDRDRILYTKAFRRLKHKTQVFISPEGDHYRTRLTHTLEVSQIARTIARGLRLNEDLTEAIALGHDLGHTPFGHTGEFMLDKICSFGFKHNEQSLRVVDTLEDDQGLNLTWEVRDGILKHTGSEIPENLEGQIIRFADRIAYINHDIEDAIRGGIISPSDLPKECVKVLGDSRGKRISSMVMDIIVSSQNQNKITMSQEYQQAKDELRSFMFKTVYKKDFAKDDEEKAKRIVEELYKAIMTNPKHLPPETSKQLENFPLERVVCDYIAGMTDRYAVKKFQEIFIPASWH